MMRAMMPGAMLLCAYPAFAHARDGPPELTGFTSRADGAMMPAFLKGGIHGKAKEAGGFGVVSRGCKESACVREGEAVGHRNGQAPAPITRRSHSKGDQTGSSVSIDPQVEKIGAAAAHRRADLHWLSGRGELIRPRSISRRFGPQAAVAQETIAMETAPDDAAVGQLRPVPDSMNARVSRANM
jgi:hypothetical protein